MKMIIYTCIVLFSCSVQIQTVSQLEHPVQDFNCTFDLKHQKLNTADGLMTINVSKCGIVTIQGNICNVCHGSQNMSVNVSWNKIRMIGKVECNCPGITEIDFSNNDLYVLRANSFIFVQYVRRIYMAGNHIYNFEERAFNGLKMLQLLDLSRNALRRIQLNVFNSLNDLRKLNLSLNEIQHIVSWGFTGLESLEELDLSHNKIYSLESDSFKSVENLIFLDLSENKLRDSKLNFLSTFSNLSVANLSRNNFASFGHGSLKGFHIHEIILSDLKRLRYILAGSFRNSDCLTKLDLSRNKELIFIEDFALQNVPNFTALDVSYTNIKSLPLVPNAVQITAIETQLQCKCVSTLGTCFDNSKSNEGVSDKNCEPMIVSKIQENYFFFIGQIMSIDCFAAGFPSPRVIWQRVRLFPNGTISVFEDLSNGYFFNLHMSSLNTEGNYRCEADSNGTKVHKYFKINIKHIDVGIRVISRNAHSVLVAWNKTLQTQRHVLLYRAFETTTNYVIQKLNEYLKVFIVRSLQPFTEYEICIASFLDINDKNCVRTMTSRHEKATVGIRHNNLAIAFLVIAGIIFCLFVVTTVYKCVHKVRIITRRNVFIIGSESRECFADVTESTFTYENQHTELLTDKTEL